MTPNELANMESDRPDSRPPGLGRTILAHVPPGADPMAVLGLIRGAWGVVASWGRWVDEGLGDWPSAEECLGQLPGWLRQSIREGPALDVDSWMDDLHDREWVWWSGTALDHLLKVDLTSDSMPITTWPIVLVVEKAGAAVIHQGDWLSSPEALGLVGQPA